MKTRSIEFLILIIMVLFVMGCGGSFTKNAYNTLNVQATLYESAKELANEMPHDTWTEEEKIEIEKLAKRYKIAYHAALESLIAYEELKDKDNMNLVNAALDKLKEAVKIFNELVERW